jgi:excisionase family DNA binding protein
VSAPVDDPVLSPHEVAEQLRKSYETVVRYLRRGELRGVKRGNCWYIRASAVEDFLRPDAA